MFKDIELAREEMTSYESLRHTRPCNLAFDLTVNVLSASAWPTYPDIPCILPPEIKIAQDDYENHYKSKHSGRKLHWKHALAQCQIKANLPLGGKEIIVSSFQAFVLLLFNDVGPQDKINYETVKELTGLRKLQWP